MDAPSSTDIFLFDRFRLDRRIRTLSRSDEHGFFAPLAISSRALDILGVLVERPGDLVSRAEIFSAVWPDTVVEDSNLNVQIAGLRRVLDEGRIDGSCIQTIPGRGYRFAVPVIQGERAFGPPASGPQSGNGAAGPIKPVSVVPTAVPTRPRRWFGFAATFLLLAVAGASAAWVCSDRWVGSADTRPRLSMVVLPFTNLGPDPDREDVADAITASLTTDLSRIQDIFLISADKAFSSGNRKLGVRYALEGSVQRSGSQVRVNAQLIDAETDTLCGPSDSTATSAICLRCRTTSRGAWRLPSISN